MTEQNCPKPERITQFNPEAYGQDRQPERAPASSALVRLQHAALDAIKAELQRQVDHPIELALYLDIDTESCAVIDGHVDLDAIAAAVVGHLLETEQRDMQAKMMTQAAERLGIQVERYPVGGTGPTGEYLPASHAHYRRQVLGAWNAPNPEENDR